jgi:hypothetical protein
VTHRKAAEFNDNSALQMCYLKKEDAVKSPKSNDSVQPGCQGLAVYFGLTVEVIDRMEHHSLIRFNGRLVIVDSSDLQVALTCTA